MWAYQLARTAGVDALERVECPEPKAGPGQVVVRIRAASLNFRDLAVVSGAYGRNIRLPLTPLSDGAGEVVETGAGSSRFKPGDRVAGIFMQKWIRGPYEEPYGASALGGAVDGVLAEYVAFDEDGLVRLPEFENRTAEGEQPSAPASLTWEEAATLPCAAVTAWNALMEDRGVRPGETVLTLGSGGVSVFALQFARLAGAKVIATSSSNAKLERLQELGAHQLLNYKETPEWGKTVRGLTGGAGADHVVEVGGAGTLEQSLRGVRAGGTISLIGVLAGPGDFNPNWIFMKAVRLRGIYVGSRAIFEAMNRAIGAAGLRPVIDRVFDFNEAPAAYRHLQSGSHFGKVVVRIGKA